MAIPRIRRRSEQVRRSCNRDYRGRGASRKRRTEGEDTRGGEKEKGRRGEKEKRRKGEGDKETQRYLSPLLPFSFSPFLGFSSAAPRIVTYDRVSSLIYTPKEYRASC